MMHLAGESGESDLMIFLAWDLMSAGEIGEQKQSVR